MKHGDVESQEKMGDESDTQEESHREGLRLLAAMIARRILVDRSKQSERHRTELCVVKPTGIVVAKKTVDAARGSANHTSKDQGLLDGNSNPSGECRRPKNE